MIRIAAVGDVHMDTDVLGRFRHPMTGLSDVADVLLLAGDLTRHGTPEEADCVVKEFADLGVPVVAVLGNHDHQTDRADIVTELLTDAGIFVLEGDALEINCSGSTLGIAGVKGFGGGFAGRCATAFGEPEMKAFVRTTEASAARLQAALASLTSDVVVALTHYAPVPDTLSGEPLEIYPFLGSYLLGQAIDGSRATLALHGHAHAGSPSGRTPGGVRVRNVAHPVLRQAYAVFHLESP